MDKVLAFSILSASPADISAGGGLGGRWARLSWRSGGAGDHAAGQQSQQNQQQRDKEKQQGSPRRRAEGPAKAPRFAPEFDGIDCFETIVSQ